MADNKEQNNPVDERQVSVVAQYVKDISFENPNAPASLQANAERPNINVSVDVAAKKLPDNDLYEVDLKIGAQAKRNDDVLFITEVTYSGIFTLKAIPENELQPALLIFCPTMLFPYARRIVSDLSRDGGFPALMLDPIDFGRLYIQRIEQMNKENSKNS